jgi:MFS family permease
VTLVAFVVIEARVRAPMVEFSFFANRTFVGATLVAFVVSFSMLGVFFFMALYMQNILGYSPLGAGVRFLPTTLVITFVAPFAGRLSDRIGSRWPIAAGLSILGVSLFLQSRIDVSTGYSDLLPAFVLMGAGIALTMSPMSTAAMNAVEKTKAGLASGLLSMSRMVGGTFGVAAVGALFQATSRSRLDDLLSGSGIGTAKRDFVAHHLGSGQLASALRDLPPDQARTVGAAAKDAFITALSHSMRLSTAVTFAGAIAGLVLIRRPAHLSQSDELKAPEEYATGEIPATG